MQHNRTASKGGCSGSCCLNVSDLSVYIDGNSIIENVGFHAHCGEIIALIGPNGAGKSTLIRTLLKQQDYTGDITFAPAGRTKTRPLIGYVPQSPSFDVGEPVSVLDFFTCCISGRPVFLPPSHKFRDRVLKCLSTVDGQDLIDKKVGALSGGQLQRVLLALALEPVPHVLLLDEPMSGVDVEGMHLLMTLLDDIRNKFDLSIILSTHDFSILRPYVDKVLLIDKTILSSGTPEEVLSSPEFSRVFHLPVPGGNN